MNQKTKLGEAKYFLSSIKEECEVTEHFGYNLSAFLTAARSVLQYALKDVDPRNNRLAKHGAKDWYYKFTSCNAVLNFFKDKRDINIHLEPVQVRKDADITIMESIHLSESVIVKIMRTDGSEEIRPIPTESKEEPKTLRPSVESKSTYRFEDWKAYCWSKNIKEWTGNEDVITLCEKYIQELHRLIDEGTKNGFITG